MNSPQEEPKPREKSARSRPIRSPFVKTVVKREDVKSVKREEPKITQPESKKLMVFSNPQSSKHPLLRQRPRNSMAGISPVRQGKSQARQVIEPSAEFEFASILEHLTVKPVGVVPDVTKKRGSTAMLNKPNEGQQLSR